MPRIEGKTSFTNCIAALRHERQLTQQSLADALDVTRATVVALEKGDYNPSLELAFRLSRYFGKPIEDVFQGRKTL